MYWPVSWTRVYTNTDLSKLNDGAWAAPDPALASLCPALRSAARGTGPNVRAQEPGPGHEDHNYVESKNAGPIWTARAIDNNECTGLLVHEASQATHWPLPSAGKLDICWEMNRLCVDIRTLITQHSILATVGTQNLFLSFYLFPPKYFQSTSRPVLSS